MEGIDLLAISPGQLEYVFAPNVDLKATLSLKNLLSDGRGVAFKVKTSAVNRYMVRPTVGVVPSNASVNIKIYMVPQEKYTDELRGCKDRFLIHSIPVSTKAETDLHKVFSGQGRQDFRLKVLVAPPIALRSVLEGEIRGFAAHQGVDGHRQCMRKFLELLLARGVLSQSQVLLAFGVVAELFNGVRDAEPLDVTRADGVSKWTSRSPFSGASGNGGASSSGREHVFQPDPDAKPLFPSSYKGGKKPMAAYSAAFLPAGRHSPATGLSRAGSGSNTPIPDTKARSRIDSTGSAGSETGSGVHEPPSTPSGASLASIQAASTLYSSSLANRLNNGAEKSPSRSPPLRSPSTGGPARRVSDADSDAGEFVDASEALTTETSPGRVL